MSTVASILGKLTRINWRELSVAYAYLLMAWWKLSVKKEKLDRWVIAGNEPLATEETTDSTATAIAQRRSRWINLAARVPLPWALCLQRSLALCLWLEQSQINPQLRIGIRKQNDELQAHAWVEYQGLVINDRQSVSRRFTLMNGQEGSPAISQLSKVIRE